MKESIKSIIQWHEDTFKDATLEGQIDKFMKEWQEWQESRDIYELADMYIVACGIARFDSVLAIDYFFDISVIGTKGLQEAVDEKMKINRQRKWNFENGQYQHEEGEE